jgi:TPR repeat protein
MESTNSTPKSAPVPQSDVTLTSPVAASSLVEDGLKQYNQSKFKTAFKLFEQAVELGCVNGNIYLGVMYHHGQGVTQDYKKAREFYEKSIRLNDPTLLNNLGYLLHQGLGGDTDYGRAHDLFARAATMGSASALTNLAKMSECGNGVKQDYNQARRLYEEAAAKGSTMALENLGHLYYVGHGVERDYVKARKYFEETMMRPDGGQGLAALHLSTIYANGLGVPANSMKAIEILVQGYNAATLLSHRHEYEGHFNLLIMSGSTQQRRDIFTHCATQCAAVTQLKREIADLKSRITQLETQIDYAPDGVGYHQARDDFYDRAKPKTSS